MVSLRTFGTPGLNDLDPDCECVGRDFCQMVEPADATKFEIALGVSTDIELVQDGAFVNPCSISVWSCGTDWDIPSGSAINSGGGTAPISQDIGLLDDTLYRTIFTVVALAGGNLQVRFGGSVVFTVFLAGGAATYTFFHLTGTLANQEISFTTSGGGVTAEIDNVGVKEMSTIGFRIKDQAGNVDYEEYDGTSVSYPITTSSSNTIVTNPIAMIQIDWTQVVVGDCYTICIIDTTLEAANLIQNGGFDSGANWTITNIAGLGGWVITGGVADHNVNGAGPESDTIAQVLSSPLVATKCYELTFDILNYMVGNLRVIANPSSTLLGTFNSNGSKSVDIDDSADTTITFDANRADDYEIDNVSLLVRNECKTPVFESECFKLETSFKCSEVFTATNDENAFGFDFVNPNFNFVQIFRHCSKLDQPNYPRDPKNTHVDSSGDRSILYSNVTKVTTLRMDRMPEYIHDAFSLFLEHDTFTIDTVEYVYDEVEYNPDWERSSLVAGIDLEVIKDDQLLVNANCIP